MKANDFAPRNLIYFNWVDKNGDVKNIIEIFGVTKQGIFVDSNRLPDYENIGFDDIKPIPLTEDWLLKFGCKNIKDSEYYELNYIYKLRFFGRQVQYYIYWGNHVMDKKLLRAIKYVHQLQNLYFALTGNELKIK